MLKKFALLLLALFLLGNHVNAYAEPVAPTPVITLAPPPCDLDAPGNIQWGFPSANTLFISWNPVAGAWGYRLSITDLDNSLVAIQSVQATSISLTVVAGHSYRITFTSMCDAVTPSSKTSSVIIPDTIIIMELVIEHNASACTGTKNYLADLNTSTPNIFDYDFQTNIPYYIELINNMQDGQTVTHNLQFERIDPQIGGGNQVFRVKRVEGNPPNSELACLFGNASNCGLGKYADSPNGLAAKYFQFSFPYTNKLSFTSTFNVTRFYTCGTRGGFGGEGGGDRNDENDAPSTGAGLSVTPTNPFAGYLPVFFSGQPTNPVTIRLIDPTGAVRFNQTLPVEILSENQYIIPTAELSAGVYFLQVETAPGQVKTHKVLKF